MSNEQAKSIDRECFTCKHDNNNGKKESICCHCSGNLDMHEPITITKTDEIVKELKKETLNMSEFTNMNKTVLVLQFISDYEKLNK